MVHLIFFNLMFFSDLVPDLEIQETFGWVFITLTMMLLLVNISFVFMGIYRSIKLIYFKYYKRFGRRDNRKVQPTNIVSFRENKQSVMVQPDIEKGTGASIEQGTADNIFDESDFS